MDMIENNLNYFRFQRSFSLKINALPDCLTDKAFRVLLVTQGGLQTLW
jgi:hypothetical protein